MKGTYQRTFWIYFLFLVFVSVGAWAGSDRRFHDEPSTSSVPVVSCGEGFRGNNCHDAVEAVALSLMQLKAQIPGWRVVVVPANRWAELALFFGVSKNVPAFSNLITKSTYVNEALIFPIAGMDAELRALTSLTGLPRLRWVVAHEYGHLACNTHDEKKAERAAGYLQYGKANICD